MLSNVTKCFGMGTIANWVAHRRGRYLCHAFGCEAEPLQTGYWWSAAPARIDSVSASTWPGRQTSSPELNHGVTLRANLHAGLTSAAQRGGMRSNGF